MLLFLTMRFVCAAGQSAAAIQNAFPAVSLRLSQGLAGQEIKRLGEYLPENPLGISQMAFWTEQVESVKNEANNRASETRVILFSGDGNLVWPHAFLKGGYPGTGDKSGCALSAGLADEIFGSLNIVGLPVLISAEPYTVRGVWDSRESLAMIQREAEGTEFDKIELLPRNDRDPRETAMDFARDHQLTAEATLNGPVIGILCGFLAYFPLLLIGLALAMEMILKFGLPCQGFALRALVFLFLAAVILCVTGFHGRIPDAFIPTKWSDFEYWGRLAADWRGQLIELISLCPAGKDLFFRLEVLRLAAFLFLGGICAAAYIPLALERAGTMPLKMIFLPHLIWAFSALICVRRYPINVRFMYLLCLPFLALPLLACLKKRNAAGSLQEPNS